MAKQAFLEAGAIAHLARQIYSVSLRDFRPCISKTGQTVYSASLSCLGDLKRIVKADKYC
jgi:hypothetical protein